MTTERETRGTRGINEPSAPDHPVSEVRVHADGTVAFRGPDATEYYALCAISSGLKMYLATGMIPNRNWTRAAMIRAVSRYTKQSYPQSRAGTQKALADLEIRRQNLALSLPTSYVEEA